MFKRSLNYGINVESFIMEDKGSELEVYGKRCEVLP